MRKYNGSEAWNEEEAWQQQQLLERQGGWPECKNGAHGKTGRIERQTGDEGEVQKFIEHRWSIVGEYEVGCILEGFG